MMKNIFYIILKALFVPKTINFLSWLFGHVEEMASLQTRLFAKFMMLQPCYKAITSHILPNISPSKDNQTMKFGQLIEYNKINIFL